MFKFTKSKLLFVVLMLAGSLQAFSKTTLTFNLVAYVEAKTVTYFGGQQATKDSIIAQFARVNTYYNNESRLNNNYNYNVTGFHFYSNTSFDSSTYFGTGKAPETAYQYRVVYDAFPVNGRTIDFCPDNQAVRMLYSQAQDNNGNIFGRMTTKQLAHEFGHSRGTLDLYAANFTANNNQVNTAMGYQSDYNSIMNNLYNEALWDATSVAVLNKSAATYGANTFTRAQQLNLVRSFYPSTSINIRVKDASGAALSNATVQMYGIRHYAQNYGDVLSTTPTYTYTTNSSGLVTFTGAANNPFNPNYGGLDMGQYANFFVTITSGGQTRCNWLSFVDVQNQALSSGTSYLDFVFPAGTTQPPNLKPQADIDITLDGLTKIAPGNSWIVVFANDWDGTISNVQFYNGGTFLGNGNWEPSASRFSYQLQNFAAGDYKITAVITDNQGATSNPLPLDYKVYDNSAIKIAISSPANNATFTAPASITLTPSVWDYAGTISYIEYYNGTTLIGTSASTAPFTYSWTGVAAGTYAITAKAYDNLGGINTSAVTNITVNPANQLPTVSLTAPANNATFAQPATVTLTATASDADGTISKVEFYQGSTLIATKTASPYTYSWTSVAAGTYSITAKATDNNNGTKTSAAVNITVTNALPTVSLTAPTNNATFAAPATVTLTATASDADGTISKVEFYQGSTLITTKTSSPYTYSWTSVAAGTYSITAKAYDNNNGTKTSAAVNITVTGNQAPTVSLTAPTVLSYVAPATVSIAANAADADGTVSKVDFYQGTTLLYSDATSPYSYSWTGVAVGTYTIKAIATDNANATTTSSTVTITVSANQAPTVSLTAPTVLSYVAPATVSIAANAADADGTVSKVDFYQGTTLLYSDATSPYSYSWTGVAVGTYTIKAIATDNANATTTSSTVTITVTAGGTCTAQLWSATATYGTTGTAVQYNGIKYTSNFWTSGDQPDLHNGGSGSGQPWTSQGTCTSRIGEESTIAPALSVYPNPSNGIFTIVVSANTSASIVNTYGSEVANIALTEGQNQITLSLASGVYFVKANNQVTKLVIE